MYFPAMEFSVQYFLKAFDLAELEPFRYRVEDIKRTVTRGLVHNERMAELKREILNSTTLAQYFTNNPADLKTLRHDKRAVSNVSVGVD